MREASGKIGIGGLGKLIVVLSNGIGKQAFSCLDQTFHIPRAALLRWLLH